MKYIFSIILLVCGVSMEANSADFKQCEPSPIDAKSPLDLRKLVHQVDPAELVNAVHALLRAEADQFKEHENFSSADAYALSLENWKERCCYLRAAIALGDPAARAIYDKEMESKRYSLEAYDCLIAGYEEEYDPRTVLAFYWEQVAQEDPNERPNLRQAYEQGKAVRLDRQ